MDWCQSCMFGILVLSFVPELTHSLAKASCLMEENISYKTGEGVGVGGLGEPRQPNAESCRAYCMWTYPSARYYDYVTPDSGWVEGHYTCWCKIDNSGRQGETGKTAGEVNCGGKRHEMCY